MEDAAPAYKGTGESGQSFYDRDKAAAAAEKTASAVATGKMTGNVGLGKLETKGQGPAPQPQDKTTWGKRSDGTAYSRFGEAMDAWRAGSASTVLDKALEKVNK